MTKFKFKGFGTFLLKLMIVYSIVVVFICQLEFTITVSKKKTGIIQNITNVADNIYSGYKSLTEGIK